MPKKKSNTEQIKRMQEKPVYDWLSTGCTLLDLAISNGLNGIGCGRITHIYGWESAAKSVLAQEPLGAAQRKGGHVWFLDAEGTLDFSRAKDLFGLDVDADTFHYARPALIEELFDGKSANKDYGPNGIKDIVAFIRDNNIDKPCAVVVDSLSALSTQTEKDESLDKNSYQMSRAKTISTAYRKYLSDINDTNLAFIVINQARMNVGGSPFGNKMTVSGGKALDFYASTSVTMKMSGQIKNKDKQTVGCKFKFDVKKNKLAPPHRKGEFRLLFDYGIDSTATNLDWLREIHNWKKYIFKDYESKSASELALEKAVAYVQDNELEFELEQEVADLWHKIFTPPKRKEKKRR